VGDGNRPLVGSAILATFDGLFKEQPFMNSRRREPYVNSIKFDRQNVRANRCKLNSCHT
jgi:hypothetical protein